MCYKDKRADRKDNSCEPEAGCWNIFLWPHFPTPIPNLLLQGFKGPITLRYKKSFQLDQNSGCTLELPKLYLKMKKKLTMTLAPTQANISGGGPGYF